MNSLPTHDLQAQLDLALSQLLAADSRYANPKRLNRYERKVFSQFGEDGILAEIFARIGIACKSFVEFGAGDGLENNTAYLLLQGWQGLWIEARTSHITAIADGLAPLIASNRLKLRECLVTPDNINAELTRASTPKDLDLLVIDIDGNDYHVWSRIDACYPRVVVCEYNAAFPPPSQWIMEYDPCHQWDGTVKFGASLQSLEMLGRTKGYSLVGCSLGGANAFFVRDDLAADLFSAPYTAENHYEPPRYYLALRKPGHTRCYSAINTRCI